MAGIAEAPYYNGVGMGRTGGAAWGYHGRLVDPSKDVNSKMIYEVHEEGLPAELCGSETNRTIYTLRWA